MIADIQYADREDGTNFNKTSTRRYRHALEITKRAVEDWTTQSIVWQGLIRSSVGGSQGRIEIRSG